MTRKNWLTIYKPADEITFNKAGNNFEDLELKFETHFCRFVQEFVKNFHTNLLPLQNRCAECRRLSEHYN